MFNLVVYDNVGMVIIPTTLLHFILLLSLIFTVVGVPHFAVDITHDNSD
jgi:hypothetical protein